MAAPSHSPSWPRHTCLSARLGWEGWQGRGAGGRRHPSRGGAEALEPVPKGPHRPPCLRHQPYPRSPMGPQRWAHSTPHWTDRGPEGREGPPGSPASKTEQEMGFGAQGRTQASPSSPLDNLGPALPLWASVSSAVCGARELKGDRLRGVPGLSLGSCPRPPHPWPSWHLDSVSCPSWPARGAGQVWRPDRSPAALRHPVPASAAAQGAASRAMGPRRCPGSFRPASPPQREEATDTREAPWAGAGGGVLSTVKGEGRGGARALPP